MLRLDYTSDKWGKGKVYYYHHFRKNPPSLMQDSEGNYFIRGYIKVTPLGIDDWDSKQPFRTKLMPPPKVCTKLGLLELVKYRDNTGKVQIINFEDRFYVAHPNAQWTFISSPVKEENPKIDWKRRRKELEALVEQGKTFKCPYCGNILPDDKEYIQYHFTEACMKLPYDAYVKYREKQNPSRQKLHDMLRRLKMPLEKFDELILKYGNSERLWEHLQHLDSAIAISSRENPQQYHVGDYVIQSGFKPFKFRVQSMHSPSADTFFYDLQALNTSGLPVMQHNVRQEHLQPYPYPDNYGDIQTMWDTWSSPESENFLRAAETIDYPSGLGRPTDSQIETAAYTEWEGLNNIVDYDFKALIVSLLRRFKMIAPPLQWRYSVGDYVENSLDLPFKFRIIARGRIPADGSPGYEITSLNTEEGIVRHYGSVREESLTSWYDEISAESYWDSWSSAVRYNFWTTQMATLNTEAVRRVIENNWSDLSSDDKNTLDVLLSRYHMLSGLSDDRYRFAVGHFVTYDGSKAFRYVVYSREMVNGHPEYNIHTPNTVGYVIRMGNVSQDQLHPSISSMLPETPEQLWEDWSEATRDAFLVGIRVNLTSMTPPMILTNEQIEMLTHLHWTEAPSISTRVREIIREQMTQYKLLSTLSPPATTFAVRDFVSYESFPFKYEILNRDSENVTILRVDNTQRSTAFTARYNQITPFVTRDAPYNYWNNWQSDVRFLLLSQASEDMHLSWADSEILGMSNQNWNELGTGARIAAVFTMHQYGLLPNYAREVALAFERGDADTHIRILKFYVGEGIVVTSIEELKSVINDLQPQLLKIVWDSEDSPIGQGEIDSWMEIILNAFVEKYYIRHTSDNGLNMVLKTAMEVSMTPPTPAPTPTPEPASIPTPTRILPVPINVFRTDNQTIYQLPDRSKFAQVYFTDMLSRIETLYPSRKFVFKWSQRLSDVEYDPLILQTLHDLLLREGYTANFLTDRRVVKASKTETPAPAPTPTPTQPPTPTPDQVALSRYAALGIADRRRVLAFLGYDFRKIQPTMWDADMKECVYAFLMENYPLPWMERGEENPLIPHEMLFIAADVFTIAVGAVLARLLMKFVSRGAENPKKDVSDNWIIEYDIKNQGIGSIEEFVKQNDPEHRVTTLGHWLEADTLPKNKFVFVLYDPTSEAPVISDRIQGITGFEINSYGNLTHAWMVSSLKYRRTGVASKLMRFQEVVGSALGAQRIYAKVKKDNLASQGMLWSLGYYPWKDGETVYEVVKQIGSDTRGQPTRISIPGLDENPERTWESVEGTKRVIGVRPDGKLEIAVGDSHQHQLVSPAELEKYIAIDVAKFESRQRQLGLVQQQQTRERSEQLEREDTDGYADQFGALQRGKIIAALQKPIALNSRLDSRRNHIRKRVAEGWKVEGLRFVCPDGRFFEERDISKTAMDYARYLISKKGEENPSGFQDWIMQEAEEVARLSEPASNPPYHTEFRRFKPEVIEAVKHYFEVEKPWQGSDAEKLGKMKRFLAVLAGIYNIPVPTLHITSPDECGSGFYRPSTHDIHLPKISVTTLLHEFRHAMQHHIPEAKTRAEQKGIEPDARAWSLSLWYVAEPRYFMKMVREGKIFFVEDVQR